MDFGRSLKCGESSEQRMVVRNTSAIRTRVRLRIGRFGLTHEPDKITLRGRKKPSKSLRLSERYRLAEASNGIGFACEWLSPTTTIDDDNDDDEPIHTDETLIELGAFEEASCAVYALAELWGDYEDELVVALLNNDDDDHTPLIEYRVAIACGVRGAPVRLYTGRMLDEDLVEGGGGEIPVVRFGSLVQGDADCQTRKLQLQNTSHVPVEIEWRVFLTDLDDNKLIDLNLIYLDLQSSLRNYSTPSREGLNQLNIIQTKSSLL